VRIRFYLAVLIAKAAMLALRLLRRGGTQLPGRIALTICPEFLVRIGKPPLVIAVTGTNGKTTVVNILVDAYEALGVRVVSNRQGSNLNAGVASCLLNDATLGGRARAEVAILEIDERSSRLIYPSVRPDFLVVTNLFRDSVGRNAHPEYIAYVVDSALPPSTRLILNADDLITAQLGAQSNERVFFGVAPQADESQRTESLSCDIVVCPVCGSTLTYSFVRYHHIGSAFCPACDFRSPEADYLALTMEATSAELVVQLPAADAQQGTAQHPQQGTVLCCTYAGERALRTTRFHLLNDSIFNVYNQIAALAVLREAGLSVEQLQAAFSQVALDQSRYQAQSVEGIDLIMQLAKGQNAIACSRAFDYIAGQPGRKALVLNLDDYFDARGGSENITWLYDCDYEYLNNPDIAQLVIGGVRSFDQYLRLLIAGVPRERMVRTRFEADTADLVKLEDIDAVYILYDVYTVDTAQAVRARLHERLSERSGQAGQAGQAGRPEQSEQPEQPERPERRPS
jgi:UDP-N-acetylmuramyl tripeptide synthase